MEWGGKKERKKGERKEEGKEGSREGGKKNVRLIATCHMLTVVPLLLLAVLHRLLPHPQIILKQKTTEGVT